ncbi:MAG: Lrp/AsnC family transcriptional regulator [Bacteroidia bacterium]|nr:Lrp/AsnC family transcriptional regulator [Bacteroidia bacterium]MDW8158306.1 Lrp/AsnC family transcriptional regulator [Bacteroidia bacterium]
MTNHSNTFATTSSKFRLDEIDTKILEILQKNGRITNVQLSYEIGLSPAPTLERVKKLESFGIIESYHALVNAQKLGLSLVVFLEISFDLRYANEYTNFVQSLCNIPEAVEIYSLTGESDFLLKVYVDDIFAYQKFIVDKILSIPYLKDVKSNIVLQTIKRSFSLPIHKNEGAF